MSELDKATLNEGVLLPLFRYLIDKISIYSACALFFIRKKNLYKASIDNNLANRLTKRIDFGIVIYLILGIMAYVLIYGSISYWHSENCRVFKFSILALILLRITNMMSWLLRPLFVKIRSDNSLKVISVERNLVFAFIHYFELIVYFGVIYLLFPYFKDEKCMTLDWTSSIYFSAISQLTIGYGDITPVGFCRLAVFLQGISGLVIVSLTIGVLIPQTRFSQKS